MPYYCDLGHIMPRHTTRKVVPMEPNQQVEAQEELVTESLVEEVSIDGMCRVYCSCRLPLPTHWRPTTLQTGGRTARWRCSGSRSERCFITLAPGNLRF